MASEPDYYDKPALIYLATCLINGKRYVGVTCKPLFTRKSQHFYDARHEKKDKFHAAIRKYGREAFRFVVLKNCDTYREAFIEENRLVKIWATEYNTAAGGRGRGSGYKMKPEHIEKIAASKRGKSAHNRGAKHTLEAIAKMKAWRATQVPHTQLGMKFPGRGIKAYATKLERGTVAKPWLGKSRDQATKDKISAAKLGVPRPTATAREAANRAANMRRAAVARRKPVRCETDGRAFASLSEAAMAYGVHKSDISAVCAGKRGTVNGMSFVFAN